MAIKANKNVVEVEHRVKDPVRYPNVVNGYEGQSLDIYNALQNAMYAELSKKMVEIQKNK